MERVTAVLLSICVIAALLALVGLGWRSRLKRQQQFGELPPAPAVLSPASLLVEGQYVVTTTEGDWLDRIAVHSLGVKSNAALSIHAQGVLLRRTGARDVFIPIGALTRVRTESGMAGKFVEKEGLVVLSWNLAGRGVDTAFRTRHAAEKTPLVEALAELLPTEPHNGDIKDRQ
ncbi:PH-like domain-containing protein [Arthrobacter monumenti]